MLDVWFLTAVGRTEADIFPHLPGSVGGGVPCPPYTGMYIVDDDGAADDDAVEREIVGGVNFA